ncbi:efflux RND transporter periplasmic adaptor subunit [Shewanella sp. AS16]|uniref:efflux RND transporter periplasmic adaptor subunit n=1 Tax=Shewanella sp. AS16 TaxID=2907625 RepID=UPI001F328EFD|nr:efflux RND transporter periplasmic adaptor subunit [Shewanella sp. AS16]MCE9687660.1 efflux RND transporter periplasmic adaptor subunit [Shewanella sp. AS16]
MKYLILVGGLLTFPALAAQEHADAGPATAHAAANDEQPHALVLSAQQRELAGIRVQVLAPRAFSLDKVAGVTLVADRDATLTLAPQLEVRVLARHVVPGQEVKAGAPLLTLGGTAVAQAQADYINAAAEWDRIRRMAEGAVSASQRMQTRVDAELKRAILEALKMTPAQIAALALSPESIGQYLLLAPISGRVQQDKAVLGQVSAAGNALLQLTDESRLWAEAQLSASQAADLRIGTQALLRVGDASLTAKIIGRSHELDSLTRTEAVLLSLANAGHGLHAGQFGELYLPGAEREGLVLPDAALTRGGDGDWQVFIETAEGFEALEVEVLQRQRGMNLVTGLPSGSRVVMAGAFLLASELAKAGFSVHNH